MTAEEIIALREEAREAMEHARALEAQLDQLKKDVGAAWHHAYSLQDRSNRAGRPEAIRSGRAAELKSLEDTLKELTQ